mmetsp:Transcript_100937/g.290249  ORF Transcript_100937/g.290249 Transcript_100937/m.290249 type:complete len:363 (+) Transcript_100937:879-1967(+)
MASTKNMTLHTTGTSDAAARESLHKGGRSRRARRCMNGETAAVAVISGRNGGGRGEVRWFDPMPSCSPVPTSVSTGPALADTGAVGGNITSETMTTSSGPSGGKLSGRSLPPTSGDAGTARVAGSEWATNDAEDAADGEEAADGPSSSATPAAATWVLNWPTACSLEVGSKNATAGEVDRNSDALGGDGPAARDVLTGGDRSGERSPSAAGTWNAGCVGNLSARRWPRPSEHITERKPSATKRAKPGEAARTCKHCKIRKYNCNISIAKNGCPSWAITSSPSPSGCAPMPPTAAPMTGASATSVLAASARATAAAAPGPTAVKPPAARSTRCTGNNASPKTTSKMRAGKCQTRTANGVWTAT